MLDEKAIDRDRHVLRLPRRLRGFFLVAPFVFGSLLLVFGALTRLSILDGKLAVETWYLSIILMLVGIWPLVFWWRNRQTWEKQVEMEIKNRKSRGLYRRYEDT